MFCVRLLYIFVKIKQIHKVIKNQILKKIIVSCNSVIYMDQTINPLENLSLIGMFHSYTQ